MYRKEIIRLDAKVVDVITESVFRVELANGHQIVAFAPEKDKASVPVFGPGDRLVVEMTPYDMSKGRIVLEI